MSFPRYPKYKDSGVEWLGEVPEHWDAKKIGSISSLKGRLGWQGLKADEYRDDGPYVVSSAHFENHRVNWDACPHVSQERYRIDTNIQLAPDDLLLMKDGAAMGKLAFINDLPGPACLNSHLLLFRPLQSASGHGAYVPKFAFYFMQTTLFQEHIRVHGTGATFLGVSQATIARYEICLPPLPEQTAIAAFLDRETAKIDTLVAEQERLIELLKEKRQAVISHTVTKGLNPKVPMKHSGVEWLGEIPAHWDVGSLVRISQRIVVGIAEAATHAYADEGTAILRSTNIRPGRIVGDILYVEPTFAAERGTKALRARDLVTVRTGNAGVTATIPVELDGCQCFTMLITTLIPESSSEYYCYWMNSVPAQCYFSLEGWGTAQVNISVPILKALPVAIPPRAEQEAIVQMLDRQVGEIDALTAEAQRAVDLLQERRTALISAAVTGQIDVRGARAASAEAQAGRIRTSMPVMPMNGAD